MNEKCGKKISGQNYAGWNNYRWQYEDEIMWISIFPMKIFQAKKCHGILPLRPPVLSAKKWPIRIKWNCYLVNLVKIYGWVNSVNNISSYLISKYSDMISTVSWENKYIGTPYKTYRQLWHKLERNHLSSHLVFLKVTISAMHLTENGDYLIRDQSYYRDNKFHRWERLQNPFAAIYAHKLIQPIQIQPNSTGTLLGFKMD